MQAAKRSRRYEQPQDREDGGCAKCSPALVLAEVNQDRLSLADPLDQALLEISSISIHLQWYAYIM